MIWITVKFGREYNHGLWDHVYRCVRACVHCVRAVRARVGAQLIVLGERRTQRAHTHTHTHPHTHTHRGSIFTLWWFLRNLSSSISIFFPKFLILSQSISVFIPISCFYFFSLILHFHFLFLLFFSVTLNHFPFPSKNITFYFFNLSLKKIFPISYTFYALSLSLSLKSA